MLPKATDQPTEVCAMVPVPVKETFCGLPAALSVITNDPEREPNVVGWNTTLTTQFDPALREVPQLFVCR